MPSERLSARTTENRNDLNEQVTEWDTIADVDNPDEPKVEALSDAAEAVEVGATVQDIQKMKEQISTETGISDSEELTRLTDETLVRIAKDTIIDADADGIRTDEEDEDVRGIVKATIIQAAMEEAGLDSSSADNLIFNLDNVVFEEDLSKSLEELYIANATLSNGESVPELAARALEREATRWDLTPIEGFDGSTGSNEGGWYENAEGERFYVKFYENPNQGRTEFIANKIYKKLGIRAPESKILQIDGREAVASLAIADAKNTKRREQLKSQDVRDGFVADAMMANWDVVGAVYDNIVSGGEGSEDGMYRIDNGGAMTFRAQGEKKSFSPNYIPELETMRDRRHNAGKVFSGISRGEIQRQAQKIVHELSPRDIQEIVDESGLDGEERDRVLSGLLGRLDYLRRTYSDAEQEDSSETAEVGETLQRQSVAETIRDLRGHEMEHSGEYLIRPKAEVVCDAGHIEGQRVSVIEKRDLGKTEINFKLVKPTDEIISMLEQSYDEEDGIKTTPSGAVLRREALFYEGVSENEFVGRKPVSYCRVCDAVKFTRDGVTVSIADPIDVADEYGSEGTAKGYIRLEISRKMNPEEAERILSEIMEKDLGIPDALGEVSEEAERDYKIARYKWQHKIDRDLTPEELQVVEAMTRKEVYPGYSTYVEEGKHKEYLEKYGDDIRAVHWLGTGNTESIYRALTAGQMCTTERFSTGMLSTGMSSTYDLNTGGGDSVFTRIRHRQDIAEMVGETGEQSAIIYKPELFDRTDWYSYPGDRFGTTKESVFRGRLTPDQILAKKSRKTAQGKFLRSMLSGDEQMFRTGIAPSYIETIAVPEEKLDEIISGLKEKGLETFDGRPIEEVVVPRTHLRLEQEK